MTHSPRRWWFTNEIRNSCFFFSIKYFSFSFSLSIFATFHWQFCNCITKTYFFYIIYCSFSACDLFFDLANIFASSLFLRERKKHDKRNVHEHCLLHYLFIATNLKDSERWWNKKNWNNNKIMNKQTTNTSNHTHILVYVHTDGKQSNGNNSNSEIIKHNNNKCEITFHTCNAIGILENDSYLLSTKFLINSMWHMHMCVWVCIIYILYI